VALVIALPVFPESVKSPPVTEMLPDGIDTACVERLVTLPFVSTVTTGIAVEDP
jgi:hypothetical protein